MTLSNNKRFRILWHSVASFIKSGYGNTTRNITSRLVERGYDVIVSAYYGLEPGGTMKIAGVPHLPSKIGRFGEQSCKIHARSLKPDAVLLNTDWWAFPWFPRMPFTSILHSPMDHISYPEELMNLTRQYNFVLAFCRWQQEELKKFKIKSYYTPHGVDTKVFHPMPMTKARETTKFPKGKFIIGRVAANSDKEDRKSWARCFIATRLFLEDNPDAKKDVLMYCHCNPRDKRGIPLTKFAHKQGLDDIVKFTDPAMSHVRLSDEEMQLLYCSFDVLLNPSKREGFGLTIIEALACGRPVIVTDFSSMTELGKGHGWLVKNYCTGENIITTPINACTAMPDVYGIKDAIEDAYNHPRKCIKFGSKGRTFALDYDWERVIDKHWIPFLEEVKEEVHKKQDKLKPRVLYKPGGK